MWRCLFYISVLLTSICTAQKRRFLKDPTFIITPSHPIDLEKELDVFNTPSTNAAYRIIIGADVPNNKNPSQLMYQMESGHVFILLQKIDTILKDTVHRVFGFYPARQGFKVFFKKEVPGQIRDNSKREHDISLSKDLSAAQFDSVVTIAIGFSKLNYHLNDFNCYDYAVELFNSAGDIKIPSRHTRFFLFGKGGSPCILYKFLKEQINTHGPLERHISYGKLVAPASTVMKLEGRR